MNFRFLLDSSKRGFYEQANLKNYLLINFIKANGGLFNRLDTL